MNEKTSVILLTLLIVENLLLAIGLIIYLHRTCQKCQKVKEIDRMFTKLCEKCEKNGKPKNKKEQVEIL